MMLKNEKAFTLIEMLIVLMIISVLIILILPNLGDRSKEVNKKGCDALVAVVQAQVDAYYLEKGKVPNSIDSLVPEYITDEQTKCKESALTLNNGKVSTTSPK